MKKKTPTRGYCIHNPYFSKYLKSSQTVLQLFKYEPCFGDFGRDMCQIKPKNEKVIAARWQAVG